MAREGSHIPGERERARRCSVRSSGGAGHLVCPAPVQSAKHGRQRGGCSPGAGPPGVRVAQGGRGDGPNGPTRRRCIKMEEVGVGVVVVGWLAVRKVQKTREASRTHGCAWAGLALTLQRAQSAPGPWLAGPGAGCRGGCRRAPVRQSRTEGGGEARARRRGAALRRTSPRRGPARPPPPPSA